MAIVKADGNAEDVVQEGEGEDTRDDTKPEETNERYNEETFFLPAARFEGYRTSKYVAQGRIQDFSRGGQSSASPSKI